MSACCLSSGPSGLVTITVNMAVTNTASLVECYIIISNDQKTNYNYLNLACFVAIILVLINYVMSSKTLPVPQHPGKENLLPYLRIPQRLPQALVLFLLILLTYI